MAKPDPELWTAIRAHLRQNHASMCRHWFDDIEPLVLDGGTLRLLVREPVQLRYLQRSCQQQFSEAAQTITGRLLAVQFVGEDGPNGLTGGSATNPRTSDAPVIETGDAVLTNGAGGAVATAAPTRVNASLTDGTLISPDYSFDQFVVGPGNRLAHAAAVAVSEKPGQAYNPFFIHGGVGLGKTHLLQAICQAVLRRNPGLRLHYVSCEGFMTEFLDAVQAGEMANFRHRFRNVDLLVIDDIHDLAKRDRTQEEFFHTFNTLYQSGRQIVLSSDAPPNEIPDMEERLTSRFNSGLVARVDKPSYETRVAIIQQKARLRNAAIPDDVAAYIASKIDTNIRELEGAIIRVQSISMVNDTPINLDTARDALDDHGQPTPVQHLSVQIILDVVSEYYDVKVAELLSKRRHKSVALPRQVGMWLARHHTRHSLEEIGGYFGGRDHTTVMHALKTIDAKRKADPALDRDVLRLEDLLLARAAAK